MPLGPACVTPKAFTFVGGSNGVGRATPTIIEIVFNEKRPSASQRVGQYFTKGTSQPEVVAGPITLPQSLEEDKALIGFGGVLPLVPRDVGGSPLIGFLFETSFYERRHDP